MILATTIVSAPLARSAIGAGRSLFASRVSTAADTASKTKPAVLINSYLAVKWTTEARTGVQRFPVSRWRQTPGVNSGLIAQTKECEELIGQRRPRCFGHLRQTIQGVVANTNKGVRELRDF